MGIEPTTKTPDSAALPRQGDAESGAVATIDPSLASIIDAWATLPDAMKAGILAMVRASGE